MSLTTDKKRWDDLHAAYAKAGEAANEYDRQLSRKYGSAYQSSWLKKGDRDKLDALRARADKIGDKIVDLLVKISPRGDTWLSGVPAHWIRSELTWEDAIRPKNEPLSVTPPTAWGGGAPIQETPMTQEHDAEAAGAEHAQDQIENDYFMGWVREQMLEASRMDPSTVLPLETKSDAMVIARNMLRQLEEDTKRGLDPREIASLIGVESMTHEDFQEFFKGFRSTLDGSRDWLADEILEIRRGLRGGGVSEARRRATPASDLSRLHNPSIAGNIIVSNRKDFDRLLIERLGQLGRPDAVEIAREYKKLAAAYFGASRTPASTADEILDLEQRRRTGRRGVSEAAQGSSVDTLPVHIPEAAIEAAKEKYLDDLRAASPEQSEVWYQRQMERQPMFKNPGMYPWQFDLGGRRKRPRVGEARRGRPQPLTDTKLYSVTWSGGRQGNLTDREAVDLVRQLRNDWVQAGRSGQLNIQVWYRDGSLVPYADLERRFYPTGSSIPGRAGFAREAHRGGRPPQRQGGDALADQFVALYAQDVREFPDAYKERVRSDPEGSARALIDGLSETEISQMLRDLKNERRTVARLTGATAVTESRRSPTPVEDPEYVIQGLYAGDDGVIMESFGFDDEDTARSEAWKLSKSPYFEGDYVRIITRDGELVWDSRGEGVSEARRRSPKARRPVRRHR